MSKRVLWCVAAVVILLATLGIPRSLAYIGATRALYLHAAPCTELHGFPGLLQTVGFVPRGDCQVDRDKGGCHDSRECTIRDRPSGKSEKGKCTPGDDRRSCFCVAK